MQEDRTVQDVATQQPKAKRPKKSEKEAEENCELLQQLKEKYAARSVEPDEDKLFLLSLHSDLKKIPDHMKLHVKGQLLSVLSAARQASFIQTVNPGPSSHVYQPYRPNQVNYQADSYQQAMFHNPPHNPIFMQQQPHIQALPPVVSNSQEFMRFDASQQLQHKQHHNAQQMTEVLSPDDCSHVSSELDYS